MTPPKRCHCCGEQPDTHNTSPRYCALCRDGCKLVAFATINRGASCPFLRGKTPRKMVPDKVEVRTFLGDVVERDLKLGEFLWRGRVRRSVPGG